jgi:uncharacterized membrane protein YfcA
VIQLGIFSVAGAVVGATLLLVLPSSAFDAIVPVLIAIALVLVVAQPKLNASFDRRPERGPPKRRRARRPGPRPAAWYGWLLRAAQGSC